MPTVVVTLKGRELQRVIIERVTTTIGRDHRCDIAIDNPALSRHHATIHCHRGMFGVRDEGSANGIFVNGVQVQGARLADGDVLALGKFQLEFRQAGGPDIADLLPDEPALFEGDTNNPEQTMAISLVDLQKMIERPSEVSASGRPARATHASNQRRLGDASAHPPSGATAHRDVAGGARTPGSAHPLGGARPFNATPTRRAIKPEKPRNSSVGPVLVLVIVALVGLVGLLSAGLIWVLLTR